MTKCTGASSDCLFVARMERSAMRGRPPHLRRSPRISLALRPALQATDELTATRPCAKVSRMSGPWGMAPDHREARYDPATARFAGGDWLGVGLRDRVGGDAGGGPAGAAARGRSARGIEHAPRRLQRPAGAQRLPAGDPEAGRPRSEERRVGK